MTTKVVVDAHAGWPVLVVLEHGKGSKITVETIDVEPNTTRDFYVHDSCQITSIIELAKGNEEVDQDGSLEGLLAQIFPDFKFEVINTSRVSYIRYSKNGRTAVVSGPPRSTIPEIITSINNQTKTSFFD